MITIPIKPTVHHGIGSPGTGKTHQATTKHANLTEQVGLTFYVPELAATWAKMGKLTTDPGTQQQLLLEQIRLTKTMLECAINYPKPVHNIVLDGSFLLNMYYCNTPKESPEVTNFMKFIVANFYHVIHPLQKVHTANYTNSTRIHSIEQSIAIQIPLWEFIESYTQKHGMKYTLIGTHPTAEQPQQH